MEIQQVRKQTENFTLFHLHSVKKLDVSLLLLWGPCHIFEADTGDTEVVLMGVNQPIKACDDFIVRKSQAGSVEAQHPRHHLSEICQLQEQAERNK